jgi:hypothetical protein
MEVAMLFARRDLDRDEAEKLVQLEYQTKKFSLMVRKVAVVFLGVLALVSVILTIGAALG